MAKVKSEQRRKYDRETRNMERAEFYHSVAWRRVRMQVISRANGLDELALSDGIVIPADTVHHIVPYAEDKNIALREDNLIALSARSHTRVHGMYNEGAAEKKEMQDRLRAIVAKRMAPG